MMSQAFKWRAKLSNCKRPVVFRRKPELVAGRKYVCLARKFSASWGFFLCWLAKVMPAQLCFGSLLPWAFWHSSLPRPRAFAMAGSAGFPSRGRQTGYRLSSIHICITYFPFWSCKGPKHRNVMKVSTYRRYRRRFLRLRQSRERALQSFYSGLSTYLCWKKDKKEKRKKV